MKTQPDLQPGSFNFEVIRLSLRPPRLPHQHNLTGSEYHRYLRHFYTTKTQTIFLFSFVRSYERIIN